MEAVDRLSAEDAIMLWPQRRWPQEIGAIVLLDGASLRLDALWAAVQARLHLVPRFRQVLLTPRRGLGGPLWTDAVDFHIAEHVRVEPLPPGSDEAGLLAAVARIQRRPLDFARPLWEMWFLPGLAGGRVALFVRLHHAIADGVAGVATIAAFVDGADKPGTAWTPRPVPNAWALFADNVRRRAGGAGGALVALAGIAGRLPAGDLSALPSEATSLNRLVGRERAYALIRADVEDLRRVARLHGVKINDVLLSAVGGGLRALLAGRGELRDGLTVPVFVPATLRAGRLGTGSSGNLVTQMIVSVPLGTTDPTRRLRQIGAASTAAKSKPHVSLGSVLGGRLARWVLLRLIDRHPVNLTTADIVGPQETVSIAGAKVLEVFPLLPLVSRVSLGVGALSYAGRFAITVVVDPVVVPDLEVFAAAVRAELVALGEPVPPRPGRRSA